jgi:hypothetical protein
MAGEQGLDALARVDHVQSGAAEAQRLSRCGSRAKAFRVFEQELRDAVKWKSGCFAQDAVGNWWPCLAVELACAQPVVKSSAAATGIRRSACTARRRVRTQCGRLCLDAVDHGRDLFLDQR